MFNYHHSVPTVDKLIEHIEKFGNIVSMQSSSRLIENIKSIGGRNLLQFKSQFDSLGFPAGKGRGGLP